jgi:signal peptidase I
MVSGMPSGPGNPGRASSPPETDEPVSPSPGSTLDSQEHLGPGHAGVREGTAAGPSGKSPEDGKGKRGRGFFSFLRELPVLVIVAFLLALLIKTFLIQAFYIPSQSMEPTLQIGDRVLVNKVVYHLHPPRRGDIVVFEDPHPSPEVHRSVVSAAWHWLTEGLGISTNPEKDFIKRVVGLPGEKVEMRRCRVFINDRPVQERYSHVRDCRPFGPTKVPAGSLFVMGDNRINSNDSRFALGTIPYEKVVGRAFVIIWPPSRIHVLHR